MPPNTESEMLRLLTENNRLLKKLHRNAIIEMWLRILWYALIIGLPFLLYFYILEPYLETFQSSLKQFQVGVGGPFPGFEILQEMLKHKQQ